MTLPTWALWIAQDDDGAVYAYDLAPIWSGGDWRAAWGSQSERVCADSLDWERVGINRVNRAGNGRLFLLVEPLELYERPSNGRSVGLAVAGCVALLAVEVALWP